jgi:hypothetical protein
MTEVGMSPEGIRDEISRLETLIEDLGESLARCRKLILFSKIVMGAGGVLLVAILVGAIGFDPMALVGAIAAVIGGIVAFGSNASTLDQLTAELRTAETRRAELIGMIDLRLVPSNATLH